MELLNNTTFGGGRKARYSRVASEWAVAPVALIWRGEGAARKRPFSPKLGGFHYDVVNNIGRFIHSVCAPVEMPVYLAQTEHDFEILA